MRDCWVGDTPAFAVLCSSFATYREAQEQVDRDGPTVTNARGAIVKHLQLLPVARGHPEPSRRLRERAVAADVSGNAPGVRSARERMRPVDLDPRRLLSDEFRVRLKEHMDG